MKRLLLVAWLLSQGTASASGQTQVSVKVSPPTAMVNPYKREAFNVQFQIEPSPENRSYQLYASCGGEIHRSTRELDKTSPKTVERILLLTVLEDCEFRVCVFKIVEGKDKTHCDRARIPVGGGYEN